MAKQVTYNGNTYPSIRALERHLGFPKQSIGNRLIRGIPLEQAVEDESTKNSLVVFGKGYKSLAELARDYGLNQLTLGAKLRLDKSLSIEAVVLALISREKLTVGGNTFDGLTHLCSHYRVPLPRVYNRLKSGMSLEEAVFKPSQKTNGAKPITFRGNTYPSIDNLASSLGLELGFVRYTRRRLGLETKMEALELLATFFSQYNTQSSTLIYRMPYAILDGVWLNTIDDLEEALGLLPRDISSFAAYHKKKTGESLGLKETVIKMKQARKNGFREVSTDRLYLKATELEKKYGISKVALLNRGIIKREEAPTYPSLTFDPNTLFTPKHDFDKLVENLKHT